MQAGLLKEIRLRKYGWIAALAVGAVGMGCGSKAADDDMAVSPVPKPVQPHTTSTAPAGSFAAAEEVLKNNCRSCHGDQRPRAGITLTSFDAITKGGPKGPLVKAGDPDGSLLIQAMHGSNGVKQMPPRGAVSDEQIKAVEAWIKAGAKSS
jgi:cytochrome c5